MVLVVIKMVEDGEATCVGFRVLGFRVEDLRIIGLRVKGLAFRVKGLGLGFRV